MLWTVGGIEEAKPENALRRWRTAKLKTFGPRESSVTVHT
jgi:hypothetical protein